VSFSVQSWVGGRLLNNYKATGGVVAQRWHSPSHVNCMSNSASNSCCTNLEGPRWSLQRSHTDVAVLQHRMLPAIVGQNSQVARG